MFKFIKTIFFGKDFPVTIGECYKLVGFKDQVTVVENNREIVSYKFLPVTGFDLTFSCKISRFKRLYKPL